MVENFEQEQLHQGAGTSDIFRKENSLLLVFTYQNLHGAHLYQDENGNYYFRIGAVTIPKLERVVVFYITNYYIDRNGAQYHGTEDLDNVIATYEEIPQVMEVQPP